MKEDFFSYDTYLFDWDGTLCQTLGVWIEFFEQEFRIRYGLKNIERSAIVANFGNWDAPVRLGYPKDSFDKDEWTSVCDEYGKERLYKAPLYPGVRKLLSSLSAKNKKIAIVSSSTHQVLDKAISYHKLENLINVVVAAEDVSAHKPDPESIYRAVNMLGACGKVCMVGDSDKDIIAAHNAKIDSILYIPSNNHIFYSEKEHIAALKPTCVITDFSEVAA